MVRGHRRRPGGRPRGDRDSVTNEARLRPLTPVVFGRLDDVLWQAKAFEAPLAAALVPERWDVAALAKETMPVERLEQIRTGGIDGGGASARDIANVAVAEMRRSGGCLIAIEDMGKPGDAFLRGQEELYEVVGDTIVYVTSEPDADVVERVWRRPTSAAGHVALVTPFYCPPERTRPTT
jgi:hypothetical protein